jgi:ribosomal protein S18 acetylase RimI-like enzyme
LTDVSSFALKTAGTADRELLWEIFRSSRTGPSADLPEDLLRMQDRARVATYAEAYPGADDCLITVSDEPAGRVLVSRSELENRIVDIAILPPYRDRGLGTQVLRSLIDEARESAKPLRLTVATDNTAAIRLYLRLGFEVSGADAMNVAMEIRAPQP